MLRRAGNDCLAYITSHILMWILLSVTTTVTAQQKSATHKNFPLQTTIYLHLPDHHDTAFQSVEGGQSYHDNSETSNKRAAKMYAPFAGNQSEPAKKYSIEGIITLTIQTTPTTCGYSNGSIVITAAGGIAPYLFSATIAGSTFTQNTGNFQNLTAGSYQFTITDANGQTVTTVVDLSNTFAPPSVSISAYMNPSGCATFDGGLTLSASGGAPPYSYSLDNSNYQSSNVFTGLSQGLYLAFARDANGCIRQTYGNFLSGSNNACFGVGLSYSYYSCNNNGIITIPQIVFGVPPYQYSLDGMNYQDDNNFYNLGSGFQHVYLKDAAGVVNVYTITIFQYCAIDISATVTDASCGSNDGQLMASAANGAAPYTYSLDGVNFQNSNTFTGLAPGNYTLTVKDVNGETVSVDEFIGNGCPTVTAIAADETCSQKNGTIVSTGAGGSMPYKFSIDGINFQNSSTFTGLAAGSYTITIKDAAGFTSTAPVTVNGNCLLVNINIANAVCSKINGSISLSATNGAAPYRFSIDGINFQDGNLFTGLAAGDYTISVKDATNAQKDSLVTITDNPAPKISLAVIQASCTNTNGSLNITATGGTAPLQYSTDGINFQNNNVFNNLDSGVYVGYVQDANGCIGTDTVHLTALPTPVVFIGNDTSLCNGQAITLAAPQAPGYAFLWQDNSTAYNNVVTRPGTYYVRATNQFNCSASDTISIIYKSLPVISLGSDTSICSTQHLLLNASYPQSAYLWQDGSTSANFDVLQAGRYAVRVTNSCGVTSASIMVSLKKCACKFYIPTAFTPDKDGKNDIFKPGYQCLFSNYEMKLYNRFGQLMFSSLDPATGWDGSFKNKQQPIGVYVYEVLYKDNITGKSEHIKGTVTLLR